jgi:hypothetical protein
VPGISIDSHHAASYIRGKKHLPCFESIVVLAERKEHVLPWTAYMVDKEHRKQKLQREFEEYWKKKRP